MKNLHVLSAVILPILLTAACGGAGESPAPPPAPGTSPPAAAPPTAAPATGTAAVQGRVDFQGEKPAMSALSMSADPVCQKAHADAVYAQTVIVNDNGTLKDVFVYVKSGLEGKTYPVPADPVVLDQKGCLYEPHVFGVQAKQKIKILNSDDTLHNVHALPSKNRQFNIAMPKFRKETEESFDNPEVMIRVKCEVHPWMGAWVGVLAHPFFSVTDGSGAFSLDRLPAGTYTIEAWHEKYGQQTQEVTVGDGETKEIAFTFSAQ